MAEITSHPADQPDVDFVALKAGQAIGRYEVVSILGQVGGHRGKAAELLAIDPKTMYRKILAYRIVPEEFR